MITQRIHQILPTLSYGDAVSNSALVLKKTLKEMGFESDIYAQNLSPKVKKYAKNIEKFKISSNSDIIIHHFSTGSNVNDYVYNLRKIRKIMVYHNITPEIYFEGYNQVSYKLCEQGRNQLKNFKNVYDMAIADSNYNKKELDDIGYKNTFVLPIILNYSDYLKEPDQNIVRKYSDGKTNLLFLGRVAPNKKQEDVIKTFYYYKKYINDESRLFIVGSYNGMEKYYYKLKELVSYLKLKDVYFTGHLSFKELLAYYHITDVFICMSEHEGFCVPLLECMYFKIPIIAYNSCAVPETLGNSGILVNKKNYKEIAEMINIVVTDKDFRNKIVSGQTKRLKDFEEKKIINTFKDYMKDFLN